MFLEPDIHTRWYCEPVNCPSAKGIRQSFVVSWGIEGMNAVAAKPSMNEPGRERRSSEAKTDSSEHLLYVLE